MATFSNKEKLERLNLSDEIFKIDTTGVEVVVLLLKGVFYCQECKFSRKSVFDDDAQGFYLSNVGVVELLVKKEAELCIIQASSDKTIKMQTIDQNQITKKPTGHDNFSRKVETILDGGSQLSNLIIGETYKPKGNWSSWPPHKHDEYIKHEQSKQKEVHLYKFLQSDGFGIQIIYEDRDNPQVFFVQENSEVKIESGYHPVVNSPHTEMYYLWVLFGDNTFFKVGFDSVYEGMKR